MPRRPGLRSRATVHQQPIAGHGGSSFPRRLRSQFLATRTSGRWYGNFAAIETNRGVYHAFNVGSGGSHSEEALVAVVRKLPRGERVVAAFTDRSMCAACRNFFGAVLRGAGHRNMQRIEVYYIVRHDQGNAQTRQRAIRQWWTRS